MTYIYHGWPLDRPNIIANDPDMAMGPITTSKFLVDLDNQSSGIHIKVDDIGPGAMIKVAHMEEFIIGSTLCKSLHSDKVSVYGVQVTIVNGIKEVMFTTMNGYDNKGGGNVLKILVYNTMFGLLRVHNFLGDCHTNLKCLTPIVISPQGSPNIAIGRNLSTISCVCKPDVLKVF